MYSNVKSTKGKQIEVNIDETQNSFIKKSNGGVSYNNPGNPFKSMQPINNKFNGGTGGGASRLQKFSDIMSKEKKDEDLKNTSYNFTPNENNSYVANKIKASEKMNKRLTVLGNSAIGSGNRQSKDFLNSSYDNKSMNKPMMYLLFHYLL